jgi:thymidylate synthase (FAD)
LFPEELNNVSGEILKLIELAGRTAYKSEEKITEGSAEKFIASIIKRGHESVIEHFNLTVKFITDRGVTHELVRHRLVAYTQESTRYCNYSKLGMQFIKPVFWNKDNAAYMVWKDHMEQCEKIYNVLMNDSYNSTPQEARSVLPNSLKTEIVCTANTREWRHILRLRTSEAAHPQIRALMIPLLKELQEHLPILFNDINV